MQSKCDYYVQNSSEAAQFGRTMRREAEGAWTPWTEWSGCSLTCGRGVRSRYRDCISADRDGQRRLVAQTSDRRQCDGRASDFVVCTENVTHFAHARLIRVQGGPKNWTILTVAHVYDDTERQSICKNVQCII